MKIAALIVPLDPNSADLAAELACPRLSQLANLVNRAYIDKAEMSDMHHLRCGSLSTHPLGGFRHSISEILAHNSISEKTIIADELFALTLQPWATTLHPKRVLMVYSGRDQLTTHIASTLAIPLQLASAFVETLVDDLAHCNSSGSLVDLSRISLMDALRSTPHTVEDRWSEPHVVVQAMPGSEPALESLWGAWEILSRRHGLNFLSERIINERNQYRAQEIAALNKAKINKDATARDTGDIKMEMTESFVRILGRRMRYAVQLITTGEIHWKSGAKRS